MMRRSLRRQRGFIYFSTGANGAGKTLFTLADVRKLQLETGRPVYYHGFTAKQPLWDFGWEEFEPSKWQDLPDGSILVMDEAQKYMPVRSAGRPPDWIGAIAEVHRKRGFDIFLITQHPLNIDSFIRRTIAAPGWHRHFKASPLGDSSNELKWTSVVDNPQRPNSGDSGEITPRPFPKEVYDWYDSASKHTAKKGWPRKLVMGALAGVACVAMMVAAVWWLLRSNADLAKPKTDQKVEQKSEGGFLSSLTGGGAVPPASRGGSAAAAPMTTAEYLQQRTPRLPDFPHTAPVYDGATAPTTAPYPAACVEMGKTCKCYTQQATVMVQVTVPVCKQIVAHGFFVDWQQAQPSHAPSPPSAAQQVVPQGPVAVQAMVPMQAPLQVAQAVPQQAPQHESWSQGLARRNAAVRSSLGAQ